MVVTPERTRHPTPVERPRMEVQRVPSELLLSILEMTQAALWEAPSVAAAERLYCTRAPLVAEASRFALLRGTGWTASEESLLRRIAALDSELLSRLRERQVASAMGTPLVR